MADKTQVTDWKISTGEDEDASAPDEKAKLNQDEILACCRFDGQEDKIVTHEPESGYDETEVQP